MIGFRSIFLPIAAFALALLPVKSHSQVKDINWSKAEASRLTLFYPGVTSWEFLISDDHRLGGREIKQGRKDCRHCHLSKEGELDLKADEIAAGTVKMKRSHNPFEPEPLPGKKGTLTAKVQAAYDSDYLYIRAEWESKGAGWNQKKSPSSVPDRASIQLNKSEMYFKKYGCFISCHDDLNTMPLSPSRKEVEANPYYKALGRDDVRLYAYYARTSWSEPKSEKDLSKKLKDGGRIDLRSVEFVEKSAAPLNGWVFDDRRWEEKAAPEGAGEWGGGRYSAVFKVKLNSKEEHDVAVNGGEAVSVGLAIHEDGASKRKHYVSFPFTIGLGTDADIKALKVSD